MARHLDADKKYIKNLFSSDSFYNIPEYQRPYVWEDEQVTALLEDIFYAFEKDDSKEYFLGCMVWNTKEEKNDNITYLCQDILDGQQRFITLYLLFAVIRDMSSNEGMKNSINRLMKQHGDEFQNIPERNRIEFQIREDSDFLEKYVIKPGTTTSFDLGKESQSKNSSRSVRNMALAISCMKKWWAERQRETNDFQKKLDNFFRYLCNNVLVLYLATPDNLDDAYNLFTILNSRGLQLQSSDILKAQNLRLIEDNKSREKYAEEWSNYENLFGFPFVSFDAFLWALVEIKMKYRSDDNLSLAKAFEHMHKKQSIEKGEGLFIAVKKYIGHYKSIINWQDENSNNHHYFENLVHIICSTSSVKFLAPLMHYRECFGNHRIIDFLIKLDNLLSVMWLIGKKDSNTRVFLILRKMEELSEKGREKGFSPSEAANKFLSSNVLDYDYTDPNANTLVKIQDFFDLLDNENWGNYSGTRINKIKYLLLKLDLINGNKNSKINYQQQNSSLEHILPKSIEKTTWAISLKDHEIWCNRLGNLVLLDRRKNASISNSLYIIKKQKYSDSVESRAYTNKLFISYNSWTINDLMKNHREAVEQLKKYYLGNSLETLFSFHKK